MPRPSLPSTPVATTHRLGPLGPCLLAMALAMAPACSDDASGGSTANNGNNGANNGNNGANNGNNGANNGNNGATCDPACRAPGARGSCQDGVCVDWHCEEGLADTDGDPSNGCESACQDRTLSSSGALDFNLDVVRLQGKVTVDGDDPGPTGSGEERGRLTFQLAGGGAVSAGLDTRGDAVYEVALAAGTYAIFLDNEADCGEGPFPCHRQELALGQELLADGVLDFDVPGPAPRIRVTGTLTENGGELGPGGRGTLVFTSERGDVASAAPDADGDFEVELPAGTYDIAITNDQGCDEDSLPCQSLVVRREQALTAAGRLDLNVDTVRIVGSVSSNGDDLPETDGPRGEVHFVGMDGAAAGVIEGRGDARFETKIYAGTYDVQVLGTDCQGGGLPCMVKTALEAVPLTASGSLSVEVETVTLQGRVTVNGDTMPDAEGDARATLFFEGPDGSASASLGSRGEATYELTLYADTYDIYATGEDCRGDGAGGVPCLQSARVQAGFPARQSGAADFDLDVVQVSGRVRVNGDTMEDSDGEPRGFISFSDGLGQTAGSVGHRGAAQYEVALFSGSYDVWFVAGPGCASADVPCQSKRVQTDATLTSSGVVDVELEVINLSGTVTVGEERMDDSVSGASRGAVGFYLAGGGDPVIADVGRNGAATYETSIFPGDYAVGFLGTDCPTGEAGAVPCQAVTFEGCPR